MNRRFSHIALFGAGLFLVASLVVGGMGLVRRALRDLPSVDSLRSYVPPLVTHVVDAYGEPVGEFFTERRTSIPFTQIPVDLRNAVLAIEDTDFFSHWGINLKAIFRAMTANLRAGRFVQGGSTLTQQLSKTIFLTREKTLGRKFKELLLTLQIEYRYSKEEILELYLNQIYFGGGAYGVEAASRLYFGKQTQQLNLPECALLAGLIRSPNRYSPANNADIARDRRATVLKRMQDLEFISEAEALAANAVPVEPPAGAGKPQQARYFLAEIRKALEPVYGVEMLEQAGLTIQTTLDMRMQRKAQDVLEAHLSRFDAQYATATLKEYMADLKKSTTQQITISTVPPNVQGALIALDVHSGAIRAMVGGRDFATSQFNRALQAKRQPGSSFKPFVWGAALAAGFTAASVMEDYPMVYVDVLSNPTLLAETTTYAETWTAILDNLQLTEQEFNAQPKEEREETLKRYWRPQNYDGDFLGPMTIRTGLQKSRNIISVRLTAAATPRAVVKFAKRAGIESPLNAVLSLGLGTSVVNLMEPAAAYGTLASGGLYGEPYLIERVLDRRDRAIRTASPKIESRLDAQTVFLLVNIMRGVIERGTGWYARRLGRPLAGKTGTTQDQRDLLFVGFSPDIVCAVWIGYDDFRPLKKGLSASLIAVPMWTDFMKEALKGTPVSEFPTPPNIEFAKIDIETGYLALPTCPKVFLEAFKVGTVPEEFCPYDHIAGKMPDVGADVETTE